MEGRRWTTLNKGRRGRHPGQFSKDEKIERPLYGFQSAGSLGRFSPGYRQLTLTGPQRKFADVRNREVQSDRLIRKYEALDAFVFDFESSRPVSDRANRRGR